MTAVATDHPPLSTKTARQGLVRELLATALVRSQPELARLLANRGVRTTQATVSRDLDELGAVRVRGSGGDLVYVLPDDGGVAAPSPPDGDDGSRSTSRLRRLLGDLVVSVEPVGGSVVVRTPPGAAQLVASHLDRAGLPEVAGTIAGDDTVLLICRDAPASAPTPGAATLTGRLLQLVARRP